MSEERRKPPFLSEGATERIFTSIKHESLPEAIFSDLVDAVPLLGDVSTYMRGTGVRSDEKAQLVKKALLGFDFVTNLLPFGDVFDLLVPANTLSYLIDRMPPPPGFRRKNFLSDSFSNA